MEQHKKRFRFCKLDNRGSTIITVLVSMAFVLALGSILLFTTYTGYQMKVSERQSKLNFYDAETALNEIRAGIQLAVSDSIEVAYTRALEKYNQSDVEDVFDKAFVEELYKWTPAGPTDFLFTEGSTDSYYDVVLLASFTTAADADISYNSDDTATLGILDVTTDPNALILKDVTVKYVNDDGYETNITTDIYIKIPPFTYTPSNFVLSDLTNYAIVASTELKTSAANLTLGGNAFAGKVSLPSGGNSLSVNSNSTLISKGTVSVGSDTDLTIGSGSTLWANRIELGAGGHATLSGNTYVADDMELAGTSSSATLSGSYYGFGNSPDNASESSSIIVNGKSTTINFSGAQTLMLAGHSFIGSPTVSGFSNNDVLTGESLSTKNDQLAYLIPVNCISGVSTNPAIFPNTDLATLSADDLKNCVDTSAPLPWADENQPLKTLDDYNASVQLVYKHLTSSQTLVYFYMKFNDATAASTYFAAYFQANTSEIQEYMEQYSTELSIEATSNMQLSGNGVYYNEASDEQTASLISPTPSDLTSASGQLKSRYTNLCTTLSPYNDKNLGGSVFSYIVKNDDVDKLLKDTDTVLFYKDGDSSSDDNVVAIITKASDTSMNTILNTKKYKNVKIIISTGNVTVDTTAVFSGLIISDGTVTMSQSIYSDPPAVMSALQATATVSGDTKTVLDYLKIGSTSSGSSSSTGESWDLEDLVGYQNWRKN